MSTLLSSILLLEGQKIAINIFSSKVNIRLDMDHVVLV